MSEKRSEQQKTADLQNPDLQLVETRLLFTGATAPDNDMLKTKVTALLIGKVWRLVEHEHHHTNPGQRVTFHSLRSQNHGTRTSLSTLNLYHDGNDLHPRDPVVLGVTLCVIGREPTKVALHMLRNLCL